MSFIVCMHIIAWIFQFYIIDIILRTCKYCVPYFSFLSPGEFENLCEEGPMKIRGRYIKNYSFNDYYFLIPNNYMNFKEWSHGSLIVNSTR